MQNDLDYYFWFPTGTSSTSPLLSLRVLEVRYFDSALMQLSLGVFLPRLFCVHRIGHGKEEGGLGPSTDHSMGLTANK